MRVYRFFPLVYKDLKPRGVFLKHPEATFQTFLVNKLQMADAACGSWMIFYWLTPSYYDGDVIAAEIQQSFSGELLIGLRCNRADCCRRNVDASA